jgi:beta-lactamase class A
MGDLALSRRRLLVGGVAGAGVGAIHVLAPATASAAGIDTRAGLAAALDRYLATRVGTIGLVLQDNRDGGRFIWRPRTLQSYSTIKVLVLVATLKRAQERHLALTSTQKSLASRMIRYSDNAATDTLLAQVGVATCQRVADQLGMTHTVVRGGSTGWWGHSTTSTGDLVKLMNSLVLGTYLSPRRRGYVRDLMHTVTSTQRWGLGDPLPDAVHVEQKNGWGPMSTGYRLNTFGHASGYGRSYQLSILSKSPNGFTYGKTTINRVSRIVYDALDKPLT